MAFIETHLFSETLGMETQATVLLPQEKRPYEGDGKLKTVWLLHGGSGDHTAWQRMSRIEQYANEYGVAVVLPHAYRSCFTDMARGGRFFTHITEELTPALRHLFPRLSAERNDNYVAGLSNGGYGCLRIGLGRPDLYAAIGAFSAGNKADIPFADDGSPGAVDRRFLFGDGDIRGTDHDLEHLARKAAATGGQLPRIYHACGSEDPWLDLNERVRAFFRGPEGAAYDYTWREAAGHGHTWAFWDEEIVRFLEHIGLQKMPRGSRYLGG
ncbi:alpha/beta hydrolase-fold protein [Paenibacillus sp. TRM 82003]|nr:alpha/beta hydrolase-fold protein [Paenibacillus sp. TRM 82003]